MPLFLPGIPVSKRLVDLGLAVPGLVIISPLLLLITIVIRIFLGSPVIFRQERAGYKGKLFYIYKFRTMTEERDADGNLLPDEYRLPPLGKILRSLSLDELPELVNVIRGEMSLVGPRPLYIHYLPRYNTEQARRHEVLPGITGWAQINGRNAIDWEEKFRLDVWYVDNRSFWLDMKILWLTLWKTLRREGISQPGHATAGEFLGNDESEPEHA